ncbi:MAG: SH3 domain-containing protein [Chloroflexota bacterium]
MPPTMTIGDTGYVRDTGANNVRDNAGLDAQVIGSLQPDEQFTVISEPQCMEGYIWYQVENDAISGWTAESGNGIYWLLPVADIEPNDFSEINLIHEFVCDDGELPFAFDFSVASDKLVVSCGWDDRTVSIYALPSGELLNQTEMTTRTVHFVLNDTQLLVQTDDTLQLLDVETFEPTLSLALDRTRYTHLSFDRRIFFRVEGDTAYAYDVETLTELATFTHLSGESVSYVVTDVYNSHLLLANDYQTSSLFTLDANLNIISSQEIPFTFEAISPDMTVAIEPRCTFANHGCQSAEVIWYDLPTLQQIHSTASDYADLRHVTFTPDSREFMLGGCRLQTFDTVSRENIPIRDINIACYEPYLISPDWNYLIVQAYGADDEASDSLRLYEFSG